MSVLSGFRQVVGVYQSESIREAYAGGAVCDSFWWCEADLYEEEEAEV